MRIGVPKEIKNHEYRVGATPAGVKVLHEAGHELWVQKDAATRIGFSDDHYREAGAKIVATADEVYSCPMVVKVKEPQASEFALMHEGQVLFTYLHLAPDAEQTRHLLQQKVIGIAYETVTDAKGRLPLLIPMSEVAGRLSIQAGATALQMAYGGSGVLLGGVPGVTPARVVIIGGGVVGTQAARMAMGLGADVTVLDTSLDRLRYLDDLYGPALKTRYCETAAIGELTQTADLVVGAVLIPGKQAPRLLTRASIAAMKPGSVFVDVAIDQGGCSETSHATTHADPIYIVDDVVHYCVANMPGACARSATQALTNATLPYLMALANKGCRQALLDDTGLRNGLNVYRGHVTHPQVAADLGYAYLAPEQVLQEMSGDDPVMSA